MFGRKKRLIEHLLVVEDEPLIAFDNEYMLTEEGYQVVATVDRVADAVRVMADGQRVDLVLVDVSLADGSGIDVARAARERGIGVLFVTGSVPDEAAAVADGCLMKPYAPRDLLGAIAALEAIKAKGRAPRRLPGGLRLFERA